MDSDQHRGPPCRCGLPNEVPAYDLGELPCDILPKIASKLDITLQTGLPTSGYEAFASCLNFSNNELWAMETAGRGRSVTMEIFKACCRNGIRMDDIQKALVKMNVQACEIIPQNLDRIKNFVHQRQIGCRCQMRRPISATEHTESSTSQSETTSLPSYFDRVYQGHVITTTNPPSLSLQHYTLHSEPGSNHFVPCTCPRNGSGQVTAPPQHGSEQTALKERLSPASSIVSEERRGLAGQTEGHMGRHHQFQSPNSLKFVNGQCSSDEDTKCPEKAQRNPKRKRPKLQQNAGIFVTGGSCPEEMTWIRDILRDDFSQIFPERKIVWDPGSWSVKEETWRKTFRKAHYVIICVTAQYVSIVKQRLRRESQISYRPVDINNAIQRELMDNNNNNKRFFTVIFSETDVRPSQVPSSLKVAPYTWPQERNKLLECIRRSVDGLNR